IYKVNLTLNRDKINSTMNFQTEALIGIYLDGERQPLNQVITLHKYSEETNQSIFECMENSNLENKISIYRAKYTGLIRLKPNTSKYTISYELCCRTTSENILELNTPSEPFFLKAEIPPTKYYNSSFLDYSKGVLIGNTNDTFKHQFPKFDAEGDSLVITTIAPMAGAATPDYSTPNPAPTLTQSRSVLYKSGYSKEYPYGALGYSNMDKNSNTYTYFIPETGVYYISFNIAEYRNNALIANRNIDLAVYSVDADSDQFDKANIPKNLNGRIVSENQISLNWTNCQNSISHYKIYRSEDDGDYVSIDSTPYYQMIYSDFNTVRDKKYKYFVEGIPLAQYVSGRSDTIALVPRVLNTKGLNLSKNIKVYPNPSSGIINIKLLEPAQSVCLRSLSGQLLYSDKKLRTGVSTINTRHIMTGLYLLEIVTETQRYYHKVLINQ
ncbi:MAG: T9SS type A sorting domain-containing protein, partial [Bacteroidia bacterium]